MGILKDFKAFIMRGNVVDLAVAVVIGAAFAAIVSSLVDNLITPLLLAPALKAANLQDIDKLAWGTVKYGLFLAAVIKFVIIAFILFLIIKGIHSFDKKKAEAPPPPPEPTLTEKLLTEIRDELKKQNGPGTATSASGVPRP
jgi:large conductance mechanosensitive channel